MSRENQTQGGDQERLSAGNWQTIAVLNLGQSPYLVRENEQARISYEHINANNGRQRLHFIQETRHLPRETVVAFKDLEANRTTLAQVGFAIPTVQWREKSSGFDEFTLSFRAVDAQKMQQTQIDLSQHEVMDLFLPGQANRAASFFTVDTTSNELIGIRLSRAFPILMTMVPGVENAQFSSKVGLLTVLDNIYTKLSERASTLQQIVEGKLIEAFADDQGPLQFQYDTSTMAKRRQREIQKKVYQIQAYLLALKAEESGNGINDPDLQQHIPFLNQQRPTQQGGLTRLFGRPQPTTQNQPQKIIDNTIWTNLLKNPETVEPHLPEPTAPAAQPARPVQSTPDIARQHSPPSGTIRLPATTTPAPETPAPMTERQKAVMAARALNLGLNETLQLFKDMSVEQVGKPSVDILNIHIDKLIDLAKQYTSQRRKGKAPENPTPYVIRPRANTINIAHIEDANAYEFLSGVVDETNYKAKIESAFQVWEQTIRPIVENTHSDSEQRLNALRPSSAAWQSAPDTVKELVKQARILLNKNPHTAGKDINVVDVSRLVLASQIVYALEEYFTQIKNRGESVEIDNWASYCLSTLTRLRGVIPANRH